jgi:hypothetical protein
MPLDCVGAWLREGFDDVRVAFSVIAIMRVADSGDGGLARSR